MKLIGILAISFLALSCTKKEKAADAKAVDSEKLIPFSEGVVKYESNLPDGVQWMTNDKDPEYASPKATRGGTVKTTLETFPLTVRTVGPDSNGAFAGVTRALSSHWSPVDEHPNTHNLIPVLATHWAYNKDKSMMFFKLDKNIKWSDGHPLTSEDFAFTLEFMRSKDIIAPWYNTYYSEQISHVVIYDDHTFAMVAPKPKPEPHMSIAIAPTPRHFYKSLKNFVKDYNWEIPPTLAPYQISNIKKGKSVTLKRVDNWWGDNKRYFKNRFNVDKIVYEIVRDQTVAFESFKKGNVDFFALTLPDYWHDKTNISEVDNGYIHKLWMYQDVPQYDFGFYLNMERPVFKDKNVRYGFAHAMNIDKVIKQVLRGDYLRKHQAATGFGPYTNLDIKARKFDLKKAASFFDKAGFSKKGPDGIRMKGNMRLEAKVTYGSATHTPRLVVLKEEFKKAGFELKLNLMDGATSFKSALEKKHDLWWGGLGGVPRPQYWGFFHSVNAFKPQTNNFTATADKELDKMIDDYRAAISVKERISLSNKIQVKIHEIGAYVPTYYTPYTRAGYWRWIKLPEVPGTNDGGIGISMLAPISGGLFWVDEAEKKATLDAKKSGKKFKKVVKIDTTFKAKG